MGVPGAANLGRQSIGLRIMAKIDGKCDEREVFALRREEPHKIL
jgi:hypothetical protein